VPDLASYEETAVRLGQAGDELAVLRARLAANRLSCALFDTQRYARNLERAFDALWEACARGAKPAPIRL
jgi:protein O-GlcNAc transferase